jgi:hypothetical protein
MPRRALLCALALCLGSVVVPLAPALAAPPPSYLPPVDAPVVDPFRAPPGPYAAGNRGLEYGTAPGTEVYASASGVVTFAGLVAGSRHVTVLHPDGLRTTYSFLAEIAVVVGQRVAQGDVVGTSAGHLHLGARVGDAYLDPASLFGSAATQVHLVPFDDPPGSGPGGERSAIRQLIGGIGGALGSVADRLVGGALDGAGATADWLRQGGGQALRTAVQYLEQVGPGSAELRVLLAGLQAWSRAEAVASRACTPSGRPPPPPAERRVALLVAGLGSSSDDAAIDEVDTVALGYDAPDVVRFSYAGGRTPDAHDGLDVPATSYGPADTLADLHTSGTRLADLIEAVVAAAPGVVLDVFAHSQGGLVTRLALIELERRHGAAWLEHLGLVATLGTPHGGADLATAVYALGATQVGSASLDAVSGALDLELDHDAPAIRELAETSDLIAELAASTPPAGVDVVSIAARGDLVVPVPRTEVPGAVQVVVPVAGLHAHDALPGSPEAGRELALALAGLPPTCTSLRTALADQLIGQGISWAEDTAGSVAWLTASQAGLPIGG